MMKILLVFDKNRLGDKDIEKVKGTLLKTVLEISDNASLSVLEDTNED